MVYFICTQCLPHKIAGYAVIKDYQAFLLSLLHVKEVECARPAT